MLNSVVIEGTVIQITGTENQGCIFIKNTTRGKSFTIRCVVRDNLWNSLITLSINSKIRAVGRLEESNNRLYIVCEHIEIAPRLTAED